MPRDATLVRELNEIRFIKKKELQQKGQKGEEINK
jgi:hypothetical protein